MPIEVRLIYIFKKKKILIALRICIYWIYLIKASITDV